MINLRLDDNSVNDLMKLVKGKYPLTEETAKEICKGIHPTQTCTQVYGCYHNGKDLVAIMTATYSVVFPHKDGTRMVHISGAYTREDMRGRGYATTLLKAIERDAKECFHADYLCCDSTANELYTKNGFVATPNDETRLWKQIA